MKRSAFYLLFWMSLGFVLVSASCRLAGGLLDTPVQAEPEIQIQPAETQAGPSAYPSPDTESSQPESLATPLPDVTPQDAAPPAVDPGDTPQEIPPVDSAGAESVPCAEDICVLDGFFLLERPIATSGRNTIDPSLRFGSYVRATRAANHGVEFLNSSGTPVLASAAGRVVVAGDDRRDIHANQRNVYGNLVVIEHDLPGINAPLYTLYAHLSVVSVEVGDWVDAGQEIGQVGMTGIAPGSTLHFEVRLRENTWQAARNPELWLQQLEDDHGALLGAIAGRIVNAKGDYLQVDNIVFEQLAGQGQPALETYYLKAYGDRRQAGLPPAEENFVLGDLPPGDYQISFYAAGVLHQAVVEVEPGRLTLVKFTTATP